MKRVQWVGKVSIESAGALGATLSDALAGAKQVSVDLHECTSIDLSGLQLLCSAAVSAALAGKELQLLLHHESSVYSMAARGGFLRQSPCRRECGSNCLWLGDTDLI